MSTQSVSSQQPRTAPAPSQSRAIAQALRRDCNIAASAFVVFGLDDRGEPFELRSDKLDYLRPQLARSAAWRDLVSYVDGLPPAFGRGGPQIYPSDEPEWVDVASQVTTDSDESRRASFSQSNQQLRKAEKSKVKIKSPRAEPARPRKRQRSTSRNQSLAEDDDDENEDWSVVGADIEPEEQQVVRFPIEDRKEVIAILGRRLDQMQQLACKVILKAWIRAIEPKKQSNYPYVASDKKKKQEAEKNGMKKRTKSKDGPLVPPWWPSTPEEWWSSIPHSACAGLEEVRHKEPDHLRKDERLVLGVHILLHQAQQESGIDLLVHSTKDCVLQFDQDSQNGDDRRGKRDMFLNDIYTLAQHYSDFVTDGIDGDTVISMKCYPKHALQNKKAASGSTRKRQRQDSSVETQEAQQAPKQPPVQEQEDLVQSTRQLELENQSWDYSHRIPDGLPEAQPPQVNSFFPETTGYRAYAPSVGKPFSDTSDLQPAYQQAPMMPPQVYDERFAFDAKQPSNYIDNSTYPMSRDPSYVSQPSNYNDWRAVQSNSSFSPSSTTSLAQSSNTSYATPSSTNFPGTVNYSFGNNPQLSPQHPYSPQPQVGAMSAASPAMGQTMAVSGGPLPMMPGIRSQPGSFDEPYSNTFRTGSLSHPNIQYNMNSYHSG